METKTSRLHSSSSSLSRSRSPISDNEKRSISASPRRGPSTPVKSSTQRNDTDEEQDPNDRELLTLDNDPKTRIDETSSAVMSDNDQSHQKKRAHHRHHHHRHHKQSKSNKRSATTHHKHSVKRSKKETMPATHRNKSDDENSISSPEKNTSESEQSQSEQEAVSSNDEEGIVEGNSTPSEHRSHRHRHKKHRSSSSMNERDSQSPQSSSISLPKNNKGTQLIVNYLPASLRESDFYQLFARIAPIKLCKLITDRHTGHSYCYGFIEYHSKEDAVKAIEKFNGYRIEHKKLKVSYAQPKSTNNDEMDNDKHMNSSSSSSSIQKNPNIYITDLPDEFDEKMLERLFSKYGEIVQAKVLRDPRTRVSRGVAFVLMTSTRYAERAVKALDGYVPSGSHTPISVKYADPKKTAAAASSGNNGNHSSSSRLSSASSITPPIGPYGYPPRLSALSMIDPYYAAALHHHHRAAMNMRNLSPSPPPPPPAYYSSGNNRSSRVRDSSPGLPRSYSSSSSKHNSNILTTNMNTSSSRSSSINPSLSTNLNNSSSLAAACDLIARGCQQAIDPNGFVIYAFGLPHDCDENDLEELFRRYGEVYRVYIVRNYTTGESKGYSFVTMRNYDEACHAVDRLDGSAFQGRTIQVRFKQ